MNDLTGSISLAMCRRGRICKKEMKGQQNEDRRSSGTLRSFIW